jgi:hypothetical protein
MFQTKVADLNEAEAVSRRHHASAAGLFFPMLGHVGFVVDEMALGRIFSQYFGSSSNSLSANCSTFINPIIRRYVILLNNQLKKKKTWRPYLRPVNLLTDPAVFS